MLELLNPSENPEIKLAEIWKTKNLLNSFSIQFSIIFFIFPSHMSFNYKETRLIIFLSFR